MDRLIFTNAIGQTIEFSPLSKYKLRNISDLGGADAINNSISSPYQDGTTPIGDSFFNSKLIGVDFATMSDNLVADLRVLDNILNPKLGVGTLKFEQGGDGRVLNKVKVRKLPTRPREKNRGIGFQLSSVIFEAFDPLYSDPDYTDAEVATGANVFSFPLNISETYVFDYLNTAGVTVTNSGDVECPVTVIFDGPKTAPISIENLTTGEKIVLALDLLENERLTVTTAIYDTNAIKTDLLTGAEAVAFQYIDVAQTTFFQLALGDNTIKITSNEADVEEATDRKSVV